MTIPKWTDERTAKLEAAVGDESPVSKATVDRIAAELETSSRSVSSKLRKLDYDVVKATDAPKAFSDDEEVALREFVEDHDGEYTYAEIAENFDNGNFSAKAIQGKILSMQMTAMVKPAPKPESVKTYTDDEEQAVLDGCLAGDFVEDIASKVGKSVPSVRGKALSMMRAGQIEAMPKQRDVKGQAPDSFEQLGDVSELTVEQIAEKIGKTERGVKTMLTRRGVKAANYDGAAKQKKAAE